MSQRDFVRAVNEFSKWLVFSTYPKRDAAPQGEGGLSPTGHGAFSSPSSTTAEPQSAEGGET
jgi:hypothetical protein